MPVPTFTLIVSYGSLAAISILSCAGYDSLMFSLQLRGVILVDDDPESNLLRAQRLLDGVMSKLPGFGQTTTNLTKTEIVSKLTALVNQ
jgi:hypothetical protein